MTPSKSHIHLSYREYMKISLNLILQRGNMEYISPLCDKKKFIIHAKNILDTYTIMKFYSCASFNMF